MPESAASEVLLQNQILAGLSVVERDRLAASLRHLSFCAGDVVYNPGDTMQFVYFPLSMAVSILSVMEDGESVEVATVGNEGIVGLRSFLGLETTLGRAVAQCSGEAVTLPLETFRTELQRHERLYALVNRYSHALLTQMFQSAGCNRLHTAEQRCARWLLAMRDRCRSDELPITQEFLGAILGVRRQSVGLMEEQMERAGLIRYSRGKIRILDRAALQAVACECYKKVKEEFDRYLK